jgi:chorismate synthase
MNIFGNAFRLSIFGESHGESVGIVIDGLPAGIPLKLADFQADFARRKSGAKGTTPRREPDVPRIMSGVFKEYSTGA